MKSRYKAALLVILAALAVTPYLKQLAYAERGYYAIGGEYAPLILSFVIAAIIIQACSDRENALKRKESEKQCGQYAQDAAEQ